MCNTVNYGLILGRSLIITHGPIFDALIEWGGFSPCNGAFTLHLHQMSLMVSDADYTSVPVAAPDSVVATVMRGIISGVWSTLRTGGTAVSRMPVVAWREWAQEVSK